MDVRVGEFMEERPLGHAIVKISDLCNWSEAEQLPHDFQKIIGDSYQFVQAEFLFPIVSDWSTQHHTPEKAQGIMFKRGTTMGGHLIADDPSISMWSLMAGAHNTFELLFYEAVMAKKLRLLDGITRLPLEELPAESHARLVELGYVAQSAPATKTEAGADSSPSGDDMEEQDPAADDHDEMLAALFDPLPVEALAKMFMTDLSQWKKWQDKAKANKLIYARQGTALFNPYKAGVWLVRKGAKDWDNARLYRMLANNLPARSLDKKDLLTGDLN